MTDKIIVITGERRTGKTTRCSQLIEAARAENKRVGGIITPGRYDSDGERTGFYVVDLSSGERRLLASSEENELHGTRLGMWTFDDDALDWGNARLAHSRNTDILVIDELGPLEFDHDKGWKSALPLLSLGDYEKALVVIRPECVPAFQDLGFKFELQEIKANPHP